VSVAPERLHQVGRIRLEVAAGSLASAVQLRMRAEELAWRRLPGLIETVFDALCPDHLEVRIARLDLDLGDLSTEDLEHEFPALLEQALRAALADAIASAMHAPDRPAHTRSLPQALLDEFESYLGSGTLPSRGAAHGYDPARILLRLCGEQPAELAAMLRRRGRDRGVVDRLVLQADAEGWAALLAVLSPADAALILAYLAALRQLHPQAQAQRLHMELPALDRALSMLTLTYLLYEPGSQFNRRSYLAFLLDGVARAEGISYAALLGLLRVAAGKTRASRPLGGSLLSVLDELFAALGAGAAPPRAVADGASVDDALASAAAGQLEPLLAQLRGAAPAAMARLVQAMPAPVFAGVIHALQPQHAVLILAHVDSLTLLHRQRPQIKLSVAGFEQQVRLMALRYLLLEAGSQFNRISWLRRVLHGLAQATGVSYRFLLGSFAAALDDLRERLPLSSSLPEGLALLVEELGQQDAGAGSGQAAVAASGAADGPLAAGGISPEAALVEAERFLRTGQPRHGGAGLCALAAACPQRFAALLRRLLAAASDDADALTERLLEAMLPAEIIDCLLPGQSAQAARWAEALAARPGASMASAWRQVLAAAWQGQSLAGPAAYPWPAQRLDRPALLRHWLDHDVLPWWAAPGMQIEQLLSGLRHFTLAELHALLDDAREERIVWRLRRLHRQLGTEAGTELLSRLAPWALTQGGPLASLSPGLDSAALAELRMRAAAAAIGAGPLDLARFVRPIAAQPAPVPPAPAANPAARDGDAELRARQALLDWLAGIGVGPDPAGGDGAAGPDQQALRLLADLLAHEGAALDAALGAGLRNPVVRQRWIAVLPDEILARLLHRLAPALARFMLDLKTVLQAAWRNTAPPGARQQEAGAARLWNVMLASLAEAAPPAQRTLARRLLDELTPATPDHGGRLLMQAQWLARQGGYANLGAVLQRQPAAQADPRDRPADQVRARPPAPPRGARKAAEDGARDGDIVYVANAGLALLHPFLPHLLRQLGLLSEDADGVARVRGSDDATRAVQLLQYMVDGRHDAPEPELALNKLLCGLELDVPVGRAWTPAPADLALCDQLLGAVTANWSSIRNTSAEGLRTTFLQRDGRLERRDGKWTLTVSRKTVDVLVDQIPWGFAVILHPWMQKELAVVW
jgi:hypothetical protein